MTFDLVTGMRVASKVGTFLPNLGMLGLWVLELFAMYAMDGWTDGWMDKSNAYCPLPYNIYRNNSPHNYVLAGTCQPFP